MKGATQLYQLTVTDTTEFQSTLPRRERPGASDTRPLRQHFNPRSREGSDKNYDIKDWVSFYISIHAPAKGATTAGDISVPPCRFQSTLPRRERPTPSSTNLSLQEFQSTLPRRERLYHAISLNTDLGISIHAPAKGATFDRKHLSRYYTISIHAPAKGATIP